MKKFNTYLQESSLSRLWRHNEKHDCGAMTAFRTAADCGEGVKTVKRDEKVVMHWRLGEGIQSNPPVYKSKNLQTKAPPII